MAPLGWAAAATLVSVFVAPTLYNYPKVLILSAAALTIARYCRRPHAFGVVAGSVLTAVAFLFRHDLAVYAGVGLLLAYVIGSPRTERVSRAWSVRGAHGAAGRAVAGLGAAICRSRPVRSRWSSAEPGRGGADGAGCLAAIHPRRRVGQRCGDHAVSSLWNRTAAAWLYSLTRLLPFVAAAFVWVRRSESDLAGTRTAVLAIAGMTAFASPLLIRGNVPVRLGDIGPLVAVLAAWTSYEGARWRTGEPPARRAGRSVAMLAIVGVTALSAASIGFVWNQLGTAGLRHGWGATVYQSQQLWASLSTLPTAAIDQPSPEGPLDISQYINRCTAPADRVVMMTYQPELLPFAGRLFGAGRLSILPDYALDSRQERALVSRWRNQSVPLAFVEFEEFWSPDSGGSSIVRAYLHERYAEVGGMPVGGDRVCTCLRSARAHRLAPSDRADCRAFGDAFRRCRYLAPSGSQRASRFSYNVP